MVRNLAEVGPNLQLIVRRLQENQSLLKLLYYTDKDPISQQNLTQEQIRTEIFEKLIKIVPRVGPKDTERSVLSIKVDQGIKNSSNEEFRDLNITIEIFVPFTQWVIKDSNLRPFAIMGEIQKSLDQKTVDGLGRLTVGNFTLAFLTDEISCYNMEFQVTAYV